MLKYRANMTEAELRAFMDEIDALDAAYASAADDAVAAAAPDDWEDETETLRRAALDSRGRP